MMQHFRMAAVLLAAILLASPGPAAADTASVQTSAEAHGLMSQIASRLSPAPVISGRFEQSKTIRGFKNPLVSSGTFVMAREQGIFWHTLQPFESRLEVTPKGIFSKGADRTTDTVFAPGEEPALRAVNQLLFAVMTADMPVLAEKFDVVGQLLADEGWSLELVPRDAMLRQWISRIELKGDSYVEHVQLEEAQGDRSTIVLSDHRPSARIVDAQ